MISKREPKFWIGDEVRVKRDIRVSFMMIVPEMLAYQGKVGEILHVGEYGYLIKECPWYWQEDMLEFVEEVGDGRTNSNEKV